MGRKKSSRIDVPKGVVGRLSLYLRELQRLHDGGHETTSSRHLGRLLGFTDAQVRKDLAHFGHFGRRGLGYRCEELAIAIRTILGTDQIWAVALIGVGNLGRALLGYRGFREQGFRIVAAFDVDESKTGSRIQEVPVYPLDDLERLVNQHKIRMAMISVPASAAQKVADRLVEANVRGIVNFAPITLSLPEHVSLVGVDLTIQLEQISFSVASGMKCR